MRKHLFLIHIFLLFSFIVKAQLYVTTGETITVSTSGDLSLHEELNNNGIITDLTLGGSNSHNLLGTGIIHTLIVNKTGGVVTGTAGMQTITNALTPTTGTLAANGFITLASTLSGSASIGQGTGSYITGNVIIQRYVGSTIDWRMIGFPFTSATTIDEATLAGFYTSGYNAYTYNETGDNGAYGSSGSVNAGWVHFTSGNVTANKGLLLSGGTIPSVINFSGPVNTGNQTIALSYTSGNTNKGWNLIANPFASNIDWDLVHAHNSCGVDNAVYRYDPNTTAYAAYVNNSSAGNQSKIIENGASFFVHSPGTNSMTINESDKTSTAPLASLMGMHQTIGTIAPDGSVNTATTSSYDQSIIKLSLSKQGDRYGDEVVLRWGGPFNVTDQFDSRYDAYDRGRNVGPDLSVIGADSTVYSIFHGSALMNSNTEKRTVQLGIKNITTGTYQLQLNLLSSLANSNQAYLIDQYGNKNILISGADSIYTFQVNADTLSRSAKRFAIAMNYKVAENRNLASIPVVLLNNPSSNHLFTLYSHENYEQLQWEIVDAAGRLLQTGLLNHVLKESTHQINAGKLNQGNYFIKLNGDGNALPVLKALKN
jgi:hypothetical protein